MPPSPSLRSTRYRPSMTLPRYASILEGGGVPDTTASRVFTPSETGVGAVSSGVAAVAPTIRVGRRGGGRGGTAGGLGASVIGSSPRNTNKRSKRCSPIVQQESNPRATALFTYTRRDQTPRRPADATTPVGRMGGKPLLFWRLGVVASWRLLFGLRTIPPARRVSRVARAVVLGAPSLWTHGITPHRRAPVPRVQAAPHGLDQHGARHRRGRAGGRRAHDRDERHGGLPGAVSREGPGGQRSRSGAQVLDRLPRIPRRHEEDRGRAPRDRGRAVRHQPHDGHPRRAHRHRRAAQGRRPGPDALGARLAQAHRRRQP